MKTTKTRRVVRGALAGLLAAATALGMPGTAAASAIGTTAIGTFSYEVRGAGVKVPVGCFLTHRIEGTGRRIVGQRAGVDCVGLAAAFSRFCNWRIDFTYADTEDRTYLTSRGATHTECGAGLLRKGAARTLPKYGKACARFYVNGRLRATQCHFVTR
ncbi:MULTISPECIES: hypothetical protein [unclassified Streptomyces]|uniref:hypothetical protein n=1 Tax=unclassified Streptomyces TaxID=2593676 RepID=UPI000DD55334|nr:MULTISPECIES: hypothetical protein [unclassified Streptomyces]QZZ30279.1 hypothetical protein A7X85_32170 [Streptomyces sp. ST1015]